MNEFDLVPTVYRKSVLIRSWLIKFLIIYVLLLMTTGVGKAVLSNNMRQESQAIERLQADKKSLLGRQQELEQLRVRRDVLSKHLSILDQLRSGPPVTEIFATIDRAMEENIWFTAWEFMRAGEYVPVKPQGVSTGYFIIVPPEQEDGEQRAWQMATHMKLLAGATDHSALARFVQRLSSQLNIDEVKIVNTKRQNRPSSSAIDFELAVIVGEGVQRP